jgi:hypothetical protein
MTKALSEAARYLADSSERYCRSYEQQGGGHMQTGRAWDEMRRGRDAVRTALAAQADAPAAQPQRALIEKIETEARRYAGMYPAASDGRNTFVIFADWIAGLALTRPERDDTAPILLGACRKARSCQHIGGCICGIDPTGMS